jgi:hypothetical protein
MGCVKASWCQDAYELTRDKPGLYTLFRPLFESVQSRILKSASVLVVVDPDDDDLLFGSIVYEKGPAPVLHHVNVKRIFRRNGLGGLLLKEAGISRSAPAVYSLKPLFAVSRQWTFVPYGLMP